MTAPFTEEERKALGLSHERYERERLEREYKESEDPDVLGKINGVLLSHHIQKLVDEYKLINPFSADQLGAAKYQLSVGAAIKMDGDVIELREGQQFLIPPYKAVQIQTEETLHLPRTLIARWNIRVDLANEGLIWVGAPQVDPGWTGRLFPPIFNLSKKAVRIKRGMKFATMDFVTTTSKEPFDGYAPKYYNMEKKPIVISDDAYAPIETALTDFYYKAEGYAEKTNEFEKQIRKVFDEMDNRVHRAEQNVSTLAVFTVAILALTTSALAAALGHMLGVFPSDLDSFLPQLGYIAVFVILVFAVAAFFVKKIVWRGGGK